MIQRFQEFSQSWIAKSFLFIVALSFAIFFGGSQWLRPNDPYGTIAEIGNKKITREEFIASYKEELQRLVKLNKELTSPQLQIKSGLPYFVLQQMINRILLDAEVKSLGLVINDEEIKQYLHEINEFKDQRGQFDRKKFSQLLQANGYFEDSFLNSLRHDLVRNQLVQAIQAGAVISAIEEELLFNAQYETRKASMMTISPDSMPVAQAPDDKTLEAFYYQHSQDFTVAELRTFKALVISPEAISQTIKVEDQEISSYFNTHKDKYASKKLPDVKSEILSTLKLQKASDAAFTLVQKLDDELAEGTTFEELAKNYHLELLSFNDTNREGLNPANQLSPKISENSELSENILETAFKTEESMDSPFAQTSTGIHYTVKVEKVVPSRNLPYAEAKEKALKAWQLQQQIIAAREKAILIVNNINEGKKLPTTFISLPDLSLTTKQANISANIKEAIFTLHLGKATFVQTQKGFAVILLQNITPPSQALKSEKFTAFQKEFSEKYKQDILNAYIQALRVRYPVKVNANAIQAIFSQEAN